MFYSWEEFLIVCDCCRPGQETLEHATLCCATIRVSGVALDNACLLHVMALNSVTSQLNYTYT